MEPTDMPDKHSDPDAVVSGRVHGRHHAAANEHMPKSVWQPGVVKRLADYIKHLREVDQQSDQRPVADQSNQPAFSGHVCARNPNRTCNCPANVCADDDATYRHARGPYRYSGFTQHAADFYTCPISGSICLGSKCRDRCESGVDYSKT